MQVYIYNVKIFGKDVSKGGNERGFPGGITRGYNVGSFLIVRPGSARATITNVISA